ncbi:hypothetical protein T484DRAFT_1930550 [Baffinella frigidus]|nr:hypothetical protein T484DRAFT_1930550 [Cryptophyta sp. CCMP2293]
MTAQTKENGSDVRRIGGSALHIACGEGHEAVVRLLIDKRANVSARGTADFRCQRGPAGVVRLLLAASADVFLERRACQPRSISTL